MGTDMVQ